MARNLHNKIQEKIGTFHASDGWLKNFKKRYGIRYLKVCGEKLSNSPDLIVPFKAKLQKKITELGLTSEQIYNADESGLYTRVLPDHTFVSCSERAAPGRKMCKDRLTFLPCTNASGSHKLKLMVIGKSIRPRAFKNFHNIPVTYKANQNAWMTFSLFKEWFHNIFVCDVTKHLESKGLPKKAILLLDNASCHPQDGELQSDDGLITTMSLPPNCTALIQPLDQNIIHLIKLNYKKSLLADLISAETFDLKEKLKKYDLKKSVCNLANAWEKITPSAIQNSWKNLLSDNSFWDEEDELPLSIIREEIMNENLYILSLLQEVSSQNFSITDINNWVDEGLPTDTLEDITENATENIDEGEVEHTNISSDEAENNDHDQKIKITDAIRSINISLQWAYENECATSEILVLKNLRDTAIAKKFMKPQKQTNILNFFEKK